MRTGAKQASATLDSCAMSSRGKLCPIRDPLGTKTMKNLIEQSVKLYNFTDFFGIGHDLVSGANGRFARRLLSKRTKEAILFFQNLSGNVTMGLR